MKIRRSRKLIKMACSSSCGHRLGTLQKAALRYNRWVRLQVKRLEAQLAGTELAEISAAATAPA